MYNNFLYRFGFHPEKEPKYPEKISSDNLKSIYSNCSDFEMRKIDVGLEGDIFVHVCWLDGVVTGGFVGEYIIRPLTQVLRAGKARNEKECIRLILQGSVYSYSVKGRKEMDDLVSDISHGLCAIVFDNEQVALCFEVRSTSVRSISEPTLEKSLKGSKDSFVETLRINTSLVRRRISSPSLKLFESKLGRKSDTMVSVMYVEGAANTEVIAALARRLDEIDVDALLAVGTIEESIVDYPRSPFPQLIHTERPDRFAMYLMDGRVGILVDGIPVGLVLPVSFGEFMKVTGDSNMNYLVSTALTLLRYLGVCGSINVPPGDDTHEAAAVHNRRKAKCTFYHSFGNNRPAVGLWFFTGSGAETAEPHRRHGFNHRRTNCGSVRGGSAACFAHCHYCGGRFGHCLLHPAQPGHGLSCAAASVFAFAFCYCGWALRSGAGLLPCAAASGRHGQLWSELHRSSKRRPSRWTFPAADTDTKDHE